MSLSNLDLIFSPRRVAVLGASNTADKVGHTVFRNLIGGGFDGAVYPVNPRHDAIQGIHAYPDVASLPRRPDLAVVCTPAAGVPDRVRECGEAGILGLIVISAGFREVGEEGRRLEAEVRKAQSEFDGMRIVGPNCLGVIVPEIKLNASFAAAPPRPGKIAFISQSGALCASVLDWAVDQDVGFSHFVSVGNMLDVSFADLIDYFGQDEETRSTILYVESIPQAREFMSAARAFARTKPVVAYKAGRFEASAQAAASHTGALAGADDVYDAAFRRAGIERVFEMDDMFDCAGLLAYHQPPTAAHLAIVTNAGGPGVMAADALLERDGQLATLSDDTVTALDEHLPASWSGGNPVDVLGDSTPERFAAATEIVLEDPGVDAALVMLTPVAMTDPVATAHAIAEIAGKASKPVLAAWMGGQRVRPGREILVQAGVPAYGSPERAVEAFMHLVSYARNLETLYETPRSLPGAIELDREDVRGAAAELLDTDGEILDEIASKRLLSLYGIPVTVPTLAESADEAVEVADELGYPVVLKIVSPQITHKTDVGGVELDLTDAEAVRDSYEAITARALEARPDAEIHGVSVQPMVADDGVELILGCRREATFGVVVMVGIGGVTTELLEDKALELPPLSERLARRMLESLKTWPLLEGYRGKPGVDVDALIEALIRLSYVAADHPAIAEIDINPLLASPQGAMALDCRVILDPEMRGAKVPPYPHLAIRPYPAQYRREATLKTGEDVVLRPIRPEDEPMWHDLLAACSQESLRFRFFTTLKGTTHQMATRYCFIDYDREMAIVAQAEVEGERQLIGVGRLIADPDRSNAEYAVLVADQWQGRGLGGQLTDFCIEIARDWGVDEVTAVMLTDNRRMIRTFKDRDFEVRHAMREGLVYARLDLGE